MYRILEFHTDDAEAAPSADAGGPAAAGASAEAGESETAGESTQAAGAGDAVAEAGAGDTAEAGQADAAAGDNAAGAHGAQRTARPTFFRDWRFKSVRLRSAHGFARPQKIASHDSAVGGRGQLVLYHHQLRAAGQKPTLPRRNWRCRARPHEVQPRAVRLALPPLPAYAGSSARHYCIPARAGNANDRQELEEVRRGKSWRGLATRFFRAPLAQPS